MLKTIKVEDVKLGMHIHAFEGAWIDHPFWKSKFTLNSQKDLVKLQQSNIKLVTIDTSKGKDVEMTAEEIPEAENKVIDDIVVPETDLESIPDQADEVEVQLIDSEHKPRIEGIRVAAHEEHHKAVRAISAAKKAVSRMFSDVRMGNTIDRESLTSVVDEVTASIERNESALISLARLKNKDDYTYMHSVAVCGLMIALGKQLDLSDSEIQQVGMAGLLHDIGKARVPLNILNKPGKLTDEEYAIVQQHAKHGYEMLREAGISDEVALDVCLHHHEKYDGSGYPMQQKAEEISIYARMGAICDVYDAVTSDRPYKKGWEPAVSLQRMAQWQGHFDEVIFKAFVKSIGIYPIGSTIKLHSERLAVVIDQNNESLLTPLVRVFYSTQSRTYLNQEDLDLSKIDDEIVSLEDPKAWGINNVEDVWTPKESLTA